MDDLISRQGAINIINSIKPIEPNYRKGSLRIVFNKELIDKEDAKISLQILPAVKPKTAEWLPDNNCVYEIRFVCSECKESVKVPTVYYKPIYEYCPWCGVKMRSNKNE